MSNELVKRVTADPLYHELNRKRSRLAWTLTIIIMVVYYGFITLIAFSPSTLAEKIGEGTTTLGFPIGIFVILIAIALTGIYVWKANTEFDRMTEELRRHAK